MFSRNSNFNAQHSQIVTLAVSRSLAEEPLTRISYAPGTTRQMHTLQ